MTPLLEVSGIAHAFGGIEVLKNVHFRVETGSITGLIGPNGAGKTTLFNMMSGLIRPQKGRIVFQGLEIQAEAPHRIARRGVARTFQNLRVFPEMTLLDNVIAAMHMHLDYGLWEAILNRANKRHIEEEARVRALGFLKTVGLESDPYRLAGTLSYGAQRRLEIARALSTEPKLILLDEPVAGMNPHESDDLKACLFGLKDAGLTLLLIEHDMRFVMSLCKEIHVLNFGRMIASGSPEVIRSHPEVIEAYLGHGVSA